MAIRMNYAEVLIANDQKEDAKKLLRDFVPSSKDLLARKKKLLALTKK
jgi:hypothetical protein